MAELGRLGVVIPRLGRRGVVIPGLGRLGTVIPGLGLRKPGEMSDRWKGLVTVAAGADTLVVARAGMACLMATGAAMTGAGAKGGPLVALPLGCS